MGRSTLYANLLALVTLTALACRPLSAQAQASGCKDPASDLELTKITIVAVEFRPESILPDRLRAQVSEALLASQLTASPQEPMEWLSQLEEVTARDVLTNQGYFKAQTEIVPYLQKAERCAQLYTASVSVESGAQYRLGKIGFIAKVFSEAQLKDQMQVAPGDIFDVSKIRASLDALRRMHCRQGYIDSTFEPNLDLDDTKGLIDLTIKVEEEKQYRINSLSILGLEKSVETALKSQIAMQKGDIVDSPALVEVLRKNQALLPTHPPREKLISFYRDTQAGTVDVVIDYRQ
jgi:outer membrane protein assembly factor BamA